MRRISTEKAPKPVAAYSQAVTLDGLVFTAGQIGIDPATGRLRDGLEAQAEQCLSNIKEVLAAAGAGVGNIARITIFLTDLTQFGAVNAIYERFVGEHRPARTTVGVAALPAGALIEIDAIAAL